VSTATSLRTEVTELLRALVRADTVNPPGNETRAAEVLRDYLAQNGIGGTRSELDGSLWSALDEWVGRLEPGARLLPFCNPGFTDSHYLREAFGTTAYGFFPLRAMDPEVAARLEHSADERAAVDDLELGVDVLRHVAVTVL
jgi:acetylornithine deacetylase/succinyl-diaminopimelate desuccinylase-like protein